MQGMAQVPPRPDLEAGPPFEPAGPSRPSLAVGLAAALIWFAAAFAAHRSIGWYPPRTALPILLAGTPVVLGLGLVATRMHTGRSLFVLSIVLLVASLVLPFVMANVVPGVAHPDQVPLPGRPAFALTAAPEGNFELWLMGGDAGHVSRLTTTPARELGADLSPDGTRVVYGSDAFGTRDLSVMTLGPNDTPGEIRPIATRDDADEFAPDWSPDGTQIAYTVDLGNDSAIWVADADGADAHRISAQADAIGPSWSPDGTRLAYSAGRAGDASDADIWIANTGGSHANDVLEMAGDQWGPYWAPDGATLLFTSDVTGDQDVWTCAMPCTESRNRTADPDATDWAAGWTPDGHALVGSDRLHMGGIFLYFIDDDGQMRLSLII
jgi:Tol biopolymer transport system component